MSPEAEGRPTAAAPRGRDTRRVVIVLGVAAIVVAAGLLAGYVLLTPHAGPSPPTFEQAESLVDRAVGNLSGGGWVLLSAFGLVVRSTANLALTNVVAASGGGCTPGPVGSVAPPSSVVVPSYGGSFGDGRSPLWAFLYHQPSSGSYLLADDLAGVVGPVATLGGAGCEANLSKVATLPSDLVDSPVVAAAGWSGAAVDAQGFVEGDPAIDTLLLLATGKIAFGSTTFSGWALEYAPCAPFAAAPTVNQTALVAAFSPTGSLDGSFTVGTPCPAG